MFNNIPLIYNADQLLDHSLRKARKITIADRNPHYKQKKELIARTDSFATIIVTKLESYIREFPSLEQLPLFYQDLIDIRVDTNKLKKSLGAVDWARKTIQSIYAKQSRGLHKTHNLDFLKQKNKEIIGRVSSVLQQVNSDLQFLADAENVLKSFPDIYDVPTVVIAGYPNVGKSSLLRCLSRATPEVAQYPFTTKEVYIGHMTVKQRYDEFQVQLIDTPGLLDRPLMEKNDIEKQAIAALQHLATVIVFILDSSETCGYSLEDQQHLLQDLKNMFADTPFIVVENKADIKTTDDPYVKISCQDGAGIEELKELITSSIVET